MMHLAKISQIIIALEKGTIFDFKGKKLDDIQIDMDIDPDESADLPVDEDEDDSEMDDVREDNRADVYDFGNCDDEVQPPTRKRKLGRTCRQVSSRPHDLVSSDDDVPGPSKEPNSRTTRPPMSSQRVPGEKSRKRVHFSNDSDDDDYSASWQTAKRVMLTPQQSAKVRTHFSYHIAKGTPPGKHECQHFMKKEPLLAGKPWLKIKSTVRNEIVKLCRRAKSHQKCKKK